MRLRSKPQPPPSARWVDAATDEYFTHGLQYYIAARLSTFAHSDTVSGNLFHHAVEMMLKGCKAHLGSDRLRKFGHRLPRLWNRFKREVGQDATLERFNPIVKELEHFERIRYPDNVLKEGMHSSIALDRTPGFEPRSSGSQRFYRFYLADIDELVAVLFEKASLNRG